MSVSLFSCNFEDDPEVHNEVLEQWLDTFTDAYLVSPEYEALSKANQKSRGRMFSLFMDLHLNYIGGSLDEIDLASVREVMEDLFPRKLFCPDSQAKTIVPELIACWQFLKREIDADTPQKLIHADAIIDYLKSIKKNYLAIFKGDEMPLPPGFDPVKELQALLQEYDGEFSNWMDDLIDETVHNLPTILRRPVPPDSWYRLYDLDELHDFLVNICIDVGIDEDDDEIAAVEALLSFAMNGLFVRIRQKEEDAINFWQTMEQMLMEAGRHESEGDGLDPDAIDILVRVLTPFRQYLSEPFTDFVRLWLAESNQTKHPDDNFTPQDLQAMCLALLDEVPDEFIFVQTFERELGFLPPEAIELIATQALSLGNPRFGDYFALLLLDDREDIALIIARLLAKYSQCISPLTLDRMIRIRNWLPKKVQKEVDLLIRNARKKISSSGSGLQSATIVETWMSIVDGSGAQGVMVMVQDPEQDDLCRLVCFVFKEAIGIVDVVTSPPMSQRRLSRTIKMARQQAGVMEKVTQELVKQQIPLFIALNLASNTALDPALIEAMELLGLQDWHPKQAQMKTLFTQSQEYAELLLEPTAKELASVQKRSVKWLDSPMGESWFVDGFENCERSRWHERMLRMSLWASQCQTKKWQKQARDFAVIGWLMAQNDIPDHDILLLAQMAEDVFEITPAC